MKYNLDVNGQTIVCTVAEQENRCLVVKSDGRERQVVYHRIDEHRLALVVDGVRIDAFVTGQGSVREILIDGVVHQVRDMDRRALAAAAGVGGEERPREVTPPMPSVVVQVIVAEGQTVARGDNLVVVSAMKMETTMTAPFDGHVVRINVAAGDKVKPGDILVDIEAVP